jgi:UDP-N-acetylmuramoyl-tripeptide--D-alanyl-D-alanine ligase
MTIEQLYQLYKQHPSVETDNRKIKAGDLFFALKGERFDGNQFAKSALEAGAAYAVVDDPQIVVSDRYILVHEVLSCLQELAKYHRERFQVPFLGITGSNGKTTTKELVHAVLSSQYITYTTQGNLNNHIGIPLTLLRVKPDAEFAIIEMGANHQKEIESYCKYAQPSHGIITNCGKAHLEGFGGVEGVKKGKGELYDYLRATNGTAFVMWDYDYLRSMSHDIPQIITYGTQNAEILGEVVNTDAPFLQVKAQVKGEIVEIQTQLVGDYNLPNVLVALAVGQHFNVPMKKMKAAIESYHPENSRSQLMSWRDNHVILDAYNANPTSMRAAIENFSRIPATRKVLLLGSMAELGEDSLTEHQQMVALLQEKNFDDVVLVGAEFAKTSHPFVQFPGSAEAALWLASKNFAGAHILVKGSRSMQMEKVLG